MILKQISRLVLKLAGWKIINNDIPDKAVVIMAPHTSNIDFVMGWLGYTSLGLKSHYLIKKEAFTWYSSGLLKLLGGISVDRRQSSNVVMQIVDEFDKRNQFYVTITPEGTRKLNHNWKRGFYFIALNANVPIVMGFLDYKNKEGGLGPMFVPTGDLEADFKKIKEFYSQKHAKYPNKFSLSEINRNKN